MTCLCFPKKKFNTLWPVLLGITFVCCCIMLYFSFHNYGRKGPSVDDFSDPHLKQAAKLISKQCKSVCVEGDCVDIAFDVIKNMDPKVDPCEDFYQFACGNFLEWHGHGNNYSVLQSQGELLRMAIKDVIETSQETQYPDSAAQKLKIVYDSCMDTKSSDLTDIPTLQTFLSDIGIRSWPKLDSNFEFSNPTLGNILGKLATYMPQFYRFYKINDNINIRMNYDECENCTDEETKNIVMEILQNFDTDHENLQTVWDSYVDVENAIGRLQNISSDMDCEQRDEVNTDCGPVIHTENVQRKSLLCETVASLIQHGNLSTRFSGRNVTTSCSSAPKVEAMSLLLESYNQRSIAHYIAVSVLLKNLKYMNIVYRKQFEILEKKKEGDYYSPMKKERAKFCLSYIVENMNVPLGLMYVSEMFSQEAIDEIDDMVQEYQKTTSEFILAQDDIPDKIKKKIIKEIENVKHLISDVIKSAQNATFGNSTQDREDDKKDEAFYRSIQTFRKSKFSKGQFAKQVEKEKNYIVEIIKLFKNKTSINEAFETFHPQRSSFLYNALQLQKRSFLSRFLGSSSVEEEIEEYSLRDMVFEANAANMEGIHLFFGLLLPPFHKYEHPKMFKIARLGEIIAHEIGHTVYAVLQENKRRDDKLREYVVENINCRKEQYSQFELKRIGEKLNPNQTENDDFADNVAVQAAEKVVESLLQNTTKNVFALPGTSFSSEQLFYVLYAQSWCQTLSIELERFLWKRDMHSPAKYRVIGVFQNSKRFSKVFECSETSYMNPQKKCPVFY